MNIPEENMKTNDSFSEDEILSAIQKRINELEKKSVAIDFCRGKGVSIYKDREISTRQQEVESELSKLKTKPK